MRKNDLDSFKDILLSWRDELLHRADYTVEGLLKSEDNISDPLDRASFETDRGTVFRIRDRESMLIKKINQSLEDIEIGDYGTCQDCGDDISIKRLKARPVTRYCIKCKTKRESYEKTVGL
ncbi:MAG: RNA polymerase-binding protein DksA [Desulfobacterales bacterium]|nr:RNA polymerase-binding protein DksA [Desulfobacterales bacterium]